MYTHIYDVCVCVFLLAGSPTENTELCSLVFVPRPANEQRSFSPGDLCPAEIIRMSGNFVSGALFTFEKMAAAHSYQTLSCLDDSQMYGLLLIFF